MTKTRTTGSIDPNKEQALNSLPPYIRESMTEEEVGIFLTQEVWPDTLCKKLSEFLYPMEKSGKKKK